MLTHYFRMVFNEFTVFSSSYCRNLFLFAATGSTIAALRFILSKSFLPYHQQVTGIKWEDIPVSMQTLILTLMRVCGIGAAIVAGISALSGIISLLWPNQVLTTVFGICIVLYWFGMFCITAHVHKKTNADTPYILSLMVFIVSLMGCVAILI